MIPWMYLPRACLFAVAYFGFAELGHLLSLRPSEFATIWPPSGLYLAVLLSSERRNWPWLFLGGLAGNLASDLLLHDKSFVVGLAFSLGNAMEAFAGAWLLLRFFPTVAILDRVQKVIALMLLSAVLSTMISATVGTATLFAALDDVNLGLVWFTWWSGSAAGIVIVAPAVLALMNARLHKLRAESSLRLLEFAFVLLSLIALSVVVFGQATGSLANRPVLVLPLLLWSALRFGAQGSALMLLVPALVILWNTVNGIGPFVAPSTTALQQVVAVQIAFSVMSLSMLILAAFASERREAMEKLEISELHFREVNLELERVKEELSRLSYVDTLTSVWNRRALDSRLAEEFARWQRHHEPLSVVMIDVDHFKSLNDNLGHVGGDRCLQALATLFKETIRPGDILGRWGGEEFMVILPRSSSSDAEAVYSRMAGALATLRVAHPASPIGPFVTFSAGIATYQGETGLEAIDVVEAADRALYQAKQGGRNRVEVVSLVAREGRAS